MSNTPTTIAAPPPASAFAAPPKAELPPFLDVPVLLEASQPQPQAAWFRYGIGIFLLIVLGSAYLSSHDGQMAGLVQGLSSVMMVGLVSAMSAMTYFTVRGQREEQQQLETIEELIQLRRWPEAGLTLQGILLRPARTPYGRIQALIYLSGVLSRYHRFHDAIVVQNYLLENTHLDGSTTHALRLGRAMAMLHEDHLFDADQAINELRRQAFKAAEVDARASEAEETKTDSESAGDPVSQAASEAAGKAADVEAGDAAGEKSPAAISSPAAFAPSLEIPWKPSAGGASRPPRIHESAGLALVEIYRDVKTGHPAEAEAIFKDKLPLLRRQLGHRVADAYVLVARAYDLMGQAAEAAAMYEKATLLAPAAELGRRYPEVAVLAQRYRPTLAPQP